MNIKKCFFIGHRDAPDSLFQPLVSAVEHHIVHYGVTEFIVGHYGMFDSLAAKAVILCKSHHPNISLTMLLPYHPAEYPIELPNGFDKSIYPCGMESVPKRFSIPRANQYAVKHADYLIAYYHHIASNTTKLLEYAHRRETAGHLTITIISQNTQ